MLFDSWLGLLRVIIVGVLAYLSLVILLRFSGKRTLSKMNAFDLVVTVALGSTLATIILSKGVALVEGVLAFIVLISLQFIIAWLSVRSKIVRQMAKSEPALLLHRGIMLPGAMKTERVTEEEVRSAVRSRGFISLEEIDAVVLETDGSFSIIAKQKTDNASALKDISNYTSKRN